MHGDGDGGGQCGIKPHRGRIEEHEICVDVVILGVSARRHERHMGRQSM